MTTSVLLSAGAKVALLQAFADLLAGGTLRLRTAGAATLVDLALGAPAFTVVGAELELATTATGVNVIDGDAADAVLLDDAGGLVAGPIPVLLLDSAEYDAAVLAGDVFVALEDTVTLVSGATTEVDILDVAVLDPGA